MMMGMGSNSKSRWAFGLLAVAVLWLGYELWPGADRPAPKAISTPQSSTPSGAEIRRGRTGSSKRVATNDPTIHLNLLAASEDVKYTGARRNIFQGEGEEAPEANRVEIAKLQAKKCKIVPDAPGCPGYDPCKANPTVQGCPDYKPPIDLKFYGFASRPGEPKKVFLSQGEQIFVAKEGDVVARRYKVVKIGVNSVQIEDLPNNNTQTLPLTAG